MLFLGYATTQFWLGETQHSIYILTQPRGIINETDQKQEVPDFLKTRVCPTYTITATNTTFHSDRILELGSAGIPGSAGVQGPTGDPCVPGSARVAGVPGSACVARPTTVEYCQLYFVSVEGYKQLSTHLQGALDDYRAVRKDIVGRFPLGIFGGILLWFGTMGFGWICQLYPKRFVPTIASAWFVLSMIVCIIYLGCIVMENTLYERLSKGLNEAEVDVLSHAFLQSTTPCADPHPRFYDECYVKIPMDKYRVITALVDRLWIPRKNPWNAWFLLFTSMSITMRILTTCLLMYLIFFERVSTGHPEFHQPPPLLFIHNPSILPNTTVPRAA